MIAGLLARLRADRHGLTAAQRLQVALYGPTEAEWVALFDGPDDGGPDDGGWDPAELHAINAELSKPADSVFEARAWELIAEMDWQHALRAWWDDGEAQAGRYASDAAVLPVLLDGLPEVPRPQPKPARRRKAATA